MNMKEKKMIAASPVQDEPTTVSLTNQIYSRLRQDIIDGVLAPDAKLKVQHLVELYGVGASPIREALSLLTSAHLVQRLDNRGFRVMNISRRELLEILEMRSLIEERALRRSIAEGDIAWEERLVTMRFHFSKAKRSRTIEDRNGVPGSEWEIWHKRFHMALISGSDSQLMLRLCDQLYDQNIRYRHIAGKVAYPERQIDAEHEGIAEAALARDADLAVKLLLAHYEKTVDYLLSMLPEN